MKSIHPAHCVCIVGGGIAGSEAAFRLAERGIYSVVIEMAALPWGKIELGLPKWHVKQRNMEEEGIDQRLSHPYVHYLPCTKLGEDVHFQEILKLKFSAVLLAVGAWKDRPLPVPRIEDYIGRGFYYQNPFVAWFNQYHSPAYDGPEFEIADDAIVVGGGLASLDVVKILMLETTCRTLADRGIKADLFELEKKGIPKILDRLGVAWQELGLKGCTLYYRREAKDMPLMPMDENPSEEQLRKAELVRQKLLANFERKYLFHFQPRRVAVDKIVEGERLGGLVFRKTRLENGRVAEVPGSEEEVRSPLVISSIGSIPEPLPGLEVEKELLRIENFDTGKLVDFENVFALGNAVTGRGNIQASRVHGRQVSDSLMEQFFRWTEEDFQQLHTSIQNRTQEKVGKIARWLAQKKLKKPEEIEEILEWVKARQERVGYSGDYHGWVEKHRPIRLEDLDG